MNVVIGYTLLVIVVVATLAYCWHERKKMQAAMFEAGRQNVRQLLAMAYTLPYLHDYAVKKMQSAGASSFYEGMLHEMEVAHGVNP